jgi:hypothetical protein
MMLEDIALPWLEDKEAQQITTHTYNFNVAVEHALRIDEYIDRYGLERVERLPEPQA